LGRQGWLLLVVVALIGELGGQSLRRGEEEECRRDEIISLFRSVNDENGRMAALPNQLNCWTRRSLSHYPSLLLLLLLLAMIASEYGCSVLLLLLRAKDTSFLPPLVGGRACSQFRRCVILLLLVGGLLL
jgi:hypothetical protein